MREHGLQTPQRVGRRHDHGSQYVADDFQDEIKFLGMTASPSFVREPQGNGCAERFIRTLKENLLVCNASNDGCHCERSEAIPIVAVEIAAACKAGLAMTSAQSICYRLLLWVRTFETVEELRLALLEFKNNYDEQWIIQRLGYKTPAQARTDACSPPQKVA